MTTSDFGFQNFAWPALVNRVQFCYVLTSFKVLKNLIEEPKAEGGNFMYHFMYEPCRHAWTHPFIVLYMDPTRVDIKNG